MHQGITYCSVSHYRYLQKRASLYLLPPNPVIPLRKHTLAQEHMFVNTYVRFLGVDSFIS